MKNKLKKLLSIVAIGSMLNGFGQSPQWLFGNTGSFPTKAYVPVAPAPMQNTNFPSSPVGITNTMVTDATGKRLFALLDDEGHNEVNGIFGNMVYYETRTTASPYVATFKTMGYTEKIVVPAPKQEGGLDCNRYFVLQMGPYINRNWKYTYGSDNATSPDAEPYYSIVNMNTNNNDEFFEVLQTKTSGGVTYNCTAKPLMDLVPGLYSAGTNNPANQSPNTFMALSKLRSDNTYLLFVSCNEKLYSFVVAYNGVSYGSLVQTVSTVNNSVVFAGEMELYDLGSNGYKLAYPTYPIGGSVLINMCEVTTAGVLKTNPAPSSIQLNYNGNYPVVHGLEFSPNGNYLYVTHETNTSHPNPIEYCSVGATSLTALSSAPSNKANFAKGQIQWNKVSGTDYLYFTSGTELTKLSNCNVPTSTTWSVVANNATDGYSNVLGNVWDQLHGNLLSSTNTSYMLPDYVDQMDYLSPYQADVCCLEYKANLNIKENITLPVGTYTVSSTVPNNVLTCTITGSAPIQTISVTFTPTTTIDGNITVPNGTKVTFQNLRMEFSDRAALIVNANVTGQQGGKVVLNATTLTSFTVCNGNAMWPGVVLNGSPSTPAPAQGTTSSSPHAVLTTVGVSQIDHALVALNIKGGAIVQYTGGSKLLDNKIAIEAEAYTYAATNDVGVFNNAVIKTQSTFNIVQPSYFARITGRVPTFRFQGCTFDNDQTTYNNLYDGVVSVDSKVSLSTGCTMNDLRYGVHHTNASSNSGLKLTVNSATFNRNITGVYVGNSNYGSVNSNNFNLLDNSGTIAYAVGLYIDNSSKFVISNNTFKNQTLSLATLNGGGTIGIIANNTNKQDNNINIIKQNTFYNLHEGIQCLNKNFYINGGNPINDRGLRLYCNNFSQTIPWTDIGVHAPAGADPSAIDYHQGQVPDSAAGNSFSHYTTNDYFHYATTTYAVDYKWHTGTTNGAPNIPGGTYPVGLDDLVTNVNCGSGGGGQRIGDFSDPMAMLQTISELKNSIENASGISNRNDGEDSTNTTNESIAGMQAQLDELETKLVIYYLNDSINPAANDSAYKYMIKFSDDAVKRGLLIDAYLASGSYKNAASVYDEMANTEASTNYYIAYGILLELYGKNVAEELLTNTTMLSKVVALANDRSDETAYLIAQNLLSQINSRTHVEELQGFNTGSVERNSLSKEVEFSVFKLSNFPNPFTGNTTLTAFVPKGIVNARIVITDVLGKVVANYNLTEGNNSVQFDKQEVKGILYYSLFVDGQRKESKMMMKQ